MTTSLTLKTVIAGIAAFLAWLFPTQMLMTLAWCMVVLWAVDGITAIHAAVVNKIPVTPAAFAEKAGAKFVRVASYMALGWVSGQMLGSMSPSGHPLAEPMGGVMGYLLAADGISILRNLSKAKNNLTFLDRFIKKLLDNIRDQHALELEGKETDTP